MTGVVLALAGLACGDGGQGVGMATAPVTAGFGGEWEGKWDTPASGGAAELRDGCLLFIGGTDKPPYPHQIRIEGAGTLTFTDERGRRYPGIYRREGPRLLICFGKARRPSAYRPDEHGACLITLSPTVPRKP